jgi:signal peptidase I
MKILKKVVLFLLFIFAILFAAVQLSPYLRLLFLQTGLVEEKISIAGTGSMYPTFPKGSGSTDIIRAAETVAFPQMRKYPSGLNLFGLTLFSYALSHGDIVEFENSRTKTLSKEKYGEEAGFVKRAVGLPGDSVELRDGFLLLNGKILDEPYIAKPRSTYGGDFLPDCKVMSIPQNSIFVLGDNRKASLDSRFELGLVDISSVHDVIPWDKQEEYKKSWRDTTSDKSLAYTVTLDPTEFVRLLNEKRKEKGLQAFKYNVLLSNSGKIRGSAMIKTNDFSTEATRSGVTLSKAIKESGYQNIIFAEVSTRGYYEADELLENFLEFPQTRKILYSSEYQDIGIAPVIGEVFGCPTQVVVAHLGGYVPPNYTKEEIESWEKLVKNLEDVLPSWRSLKEEEDVDRGKVDQLVSILEVRLTNAQRVLSKMKDNQWLDDSEKKMVDMDKNAASEAEKLIDELSKK